MAKNKRVLLAVILLVALIYPCVSAGWVVKWFGFEKKDSLSEWQEKIFKGRVIYSVRIEKAGGYLSAYSRSSASGIFYKISFDPKDKPLISWKWKVLRFPEKKQADAQASRWIEKDDYATRLYVIFPSLFFTATKCLEYVWDRSLPLGMIMTSPYHKNIKIIVAESGEKNLDKWVYMQRNIYKDFKVAFGRRPPKVGAIAIMTDTDNTLSTAEAEYDEIKVGYKNGKD